ncbi:MAG TPA: VOC family protein [Miltoncostaeaceae bacterium]|nr:VOC family protein [Miltoncostaeaceae bacterium]
MLLKLDHVGIVAHTWEEARLVLVEDLGLTLDTDRTPMPDGSYFAPEQTHNYFVQVGEGETQIEVLIPDGTTSGTSRYLARFGPGLHHLGYAVRDVEAEAGRLRENGLRQLDLGPGDPERLRAAFFHPKSVNGILTELVPERGSRPRRD